MQTLALKSFDSAQKICLIISVLKEFKPMRILDLKSFYFYVLCLSLALWRTQSSERLANSLTVH